MTRLQNLMTDEVRREIEDTIYKNARVAMMIAEERGQVLTLEQATKQVS